MILKIIIGLSKLSSSIRMKGQLLIIIKIIKIIIRLKGQLPMIINIIKIIITHQAERAAAAGGVNGGQEARPGCS